MAFEVERIDSKPQFRKSHALFGRARHLKQLEVKLLHLELLVPVLPDLELHRRNRERGALIA